MKEVKVKDYMTKQVLTFRPEDGVIETLRALLKAGRSGGPVVDDKGRLVGLISEIDCLKEALMGGYYQQEGDKVADHMATEVDVVNVDDDILAVADLFMKGRRRLPVVDGDKIVGIISRPDFARALIDRIDNPHHGKN
ncbi:MAG: CBS domain-containing protein [Hahellaceae bacterium]|nr:CBS domain-containing protein [Hahellaceae bacterium]MCP5209709.1 CBS domain-containing protein [Hahellaceae bacterium]